METTDTRKSNAEQVTPAEILESRRIRKTLTLSIASSTGQDPVALERQIWAIASDMGEDPETVATGFLLGAMTVVLTQAQSRTQPYPEFDDPEATQALDIETMLQEMVEREAAKDDGDV